MKKVFFYISIIFSLILLINIISIITTDIDRLTKYGLGYLTGKIILFLLFVSIIYLTRKSVFIKTE